MRNRRIEKRRFKEDGERSQQMVLPSSYFIRHWVEEIRIL